MKIRVGDIIRLLGAIDNVVVWQSDTRTDGTMEPELIYKGSIMDMPWYIMDMYFYMEDGEEAISARFLSKTEAGFVFSVVENEALASDIASV